MTFRIPLFFLIGGLWFAAAAVVAQDVTSQCGAALQAVWSAASNACINGPEGTICNGGSAPRAEPAGPVSNALASAGAVVEAGVVTMLHTPPIDATGSASGVAWVRLAPPLQYTALLVGDVRIRDVTPPDFPAWTSLVLETSEQPPACPDAPYSVLVLQSAAGQSTRVVVNGASIGLNGTVVARTSGTQTVFAAMSGESTVQVYGASQPLVMGQQLTVPATPGDFARPADVASAPMPFDPGALSNLPIALFPRPIVLPQPGYVVTGGPVNMRSRPSINAGIIVQVPGGETLSVLGQDTSRTWYHVRRESGETGWMLAELLSGHVGPIQTVYDATPLPPQRYGELGSAGRVLAPAGVPLRTGPDATFPTVALVADGTLVQLLARSPYSPWVKVDANGTIGWVALLTLDTHAYFDALPVDVHAPPPPTPTRVPGSFGNAFPDPNLNN